jgi:hypothetical protein
MKEPIALVVKPKEMAFAVKADFGMPSRSLTPAEFAALAEAMELARTVGSSLPVF